MKKKVIIHLPYYEKNSSQKKGFLSQEETQEVEELLKNDREINYLGNIDLQNLNFVNHEITSDNINLSNVDILFWHAPQMLKNLCHLQVLSQKIKIIKHPTPFGIVSDKFYAHSILKKHGIPVADFALVRYDDIEKMKSITKKWGTLLIKPRLGSYGRGIIKTDNYETIRDVAGILKFETGSNHIFMERYYKNDPKKWLSTTLINGKIIYGYRKNEEKFSDWKVYDINKEGGSIKYVDAYPVKKYAEKATQILNDKSIVGFDFIKTENGYILVDENNFPGLYPECFKESKKSLPALILNTIKKSL